MAEQHLTAAAARLGEANQGIELAVLNPFLLLLRVGVVDEAAQLGHIAAAMHHPGQGRQTIPAGAAGFLVVGLQAFGQVHVGHKAHIRLIDAHAKSDRGNHHHAAIAAEALQSGAAHRPIQSGVIRNGVISRRLQVAAEAIHPVAGAGVHNS